jgi:teichuronic acid biosynthesis glycosyltransferase TuaG
MTLEKKTEVAEVGVILPVFSPGPHIKNIVESLANQNFKNFRLIVIDDDHTEAFRLLQTALLDNLEPKLSEAIVFLSTPARGSGPAVARNIGLANLREPFICFFDCDDFWYEDFLEKMYAKINSRSADVVVCHSAINNGVEQISLSLPNHYSRFQLLQTNILSMPCVMVRNSALSHLYFPLCGHEDYAFWLKNIGENFEVSIVSDVLVEITKTPGSVSSKKLRSLGWYIRLIVEQTDARWLLPFYVVMYVLNAVNKRLGLLNRIVVL